MIFSRKRELVSLFVAILLIFNAIPVYAFSLGDTSTKKILEGSQRIYQGYPQLQRVARERILKEYPNLRS